jgi:mRNA interferase MazF
MASRTEVVHPKSGAVYLVNVDPTIGAEIQKTRPVLIVQNDIANRHSPITIVAAITTQFDESLYPTEVLVRAPQGELTADSVVLLNQFKSFEKRRFMRRFGALTPETIERVDRALQSS